MNLQIRTDHKRQIVDLTDRLSSEVPPAGEGSLIVFVAHTTAALTTADLDPGTDLDFLDFLECMTPSHIDWRHPHDPDHAPDHLLASMIGPGVTVPFADGRLILGTWQRVVLVELDGPRERTIITRLIC